MKSISHFATVLLIALNCGGCGSSGTSTDLTGTVLLDGRPLAGAQVQLLPKNDETHGMHSATTNELGVFKIEESGSSNNPIRPGSYVALVSKLTVKGDLATLPGGGMGAAVNEVRDVYQDRKLSPLTVEIQSATTKLPPLELTAKAP